LTLRGLADDASYQLPWEALQNLSYVSAMRTIACIGNPGGGDWIANATWGGVALGPVLQSLPLSATRPYAKLTSADGYQTGLPVATLLAPTTLLAYHMEGQALSHSHGYPVRLLVSDLYGQKMPKALTEIEFMEQPFIGYWEAYGWSQEGRVQTQAFFTAPQMGAPLRGGAMLQGLAFAGARRIVRVEVSADGGEWQTAHLIQPPEPDVWTPWYLQWLAPAPGEYQLEVRATDSDGFTQSQRPDPFFKRPHKQGNALIHSITVEVR
jgi:DMSO/TMAO reductase YedYZ molybdopterin-dependent catalytic subunit